MKTEYIVLDKQGNRITLTPFEDLSVRIVGICYCPDNTPSDQDNDTIQIFLEEVKL